MTNNNHNNNKNSNTQNNNQKVIVNINTTSLHTRHKRKSHNKPREPQEQPPPTHHTSSIIYYPQTSLITNGTHAPIPVYFQSALTNRDLALNALQTSAMAHDDHHARRHAYANGTVPGGVGAQQPAPPETHPEQQTVPPMEVPQEAQTQQRQTQNPLNVPLPDDSSVGSDTPHSTNTPYSTDTTNSNDIDSPMHRDGMRSHARELEDLYLRYKNASNPSAKKRYAMDISNFVSNHGVDIHHNSYNRTTGEPRRRGAPSLVNEFRNRHKHLYPNQQ